MRPSACLLIFLQARRAAAFASSIQSSSARDILCHSRSSCRIPSTSARHMIGGASIHRSARFQSTVLSPVFGVLRGGGSNNDEGRGSSMPTVTGTGRHPLCVSSTSTSTPAAVGATASMEGEEKSYDIDSDAEMMKQIMGAASASHHITGPSTRPATFGSLPFLDTSHLDSSSPKQHRVLFVLGGPGAGKGTQSDLIVSNYKCVHLSVGELLREARAGNSPHAELIEDCLVHGKIVPVEISLELLQSAMDEAYERPAADGCKYGTRLFLVDGFPRNFDNLAGWIGNMPRAASCLGALVYDCPQDVLEARILSRAETSGRSDDNLTSARKRFKTFQMQTMPVVRALEEVEKAQDSEEPEGRSRIRITHIEATGTVEEVWDATRTAMDHYVTNDVLSANSRLIKAALEGDADAYLELCDNSMFINSKEEGQESDNEASNFDDDTLKALFAEFEPSENTADNITALADVISNAKASMESGTKAVVSYDRIFETKNGKEKTLRETRVWSHGEEGWKCVHFYRQPIT